MASLKDCRDIWDWLQEAKRQHIEGPKLPEKPPEPFCLELEGTIWFGADRKRHDENENT